MNIHLVFNTFMVSNFVLIQLILHTPSHMLNNLDFDNSSGADAHSYATYRLCFPVLQHVQSCPVNICVTNSP